MLGEVFMKRKILLTAALIAVFAAFLSTDSNAQSKYITSVNIKTDMVQGAKIEATNVPVFGTQLDWIQINIDFTTARTASPMGKNYYEWIDDIRVEIELLLPTGHPQKQYALLLGKADYWSFALDGKEHHIVMFVPPVFIKRYAPAQKISGADVKKFEIKVTFKMNDAVIGTGFTGPKNKTDREIATRFEKIKLMPDIDRVKNSIFGIDKTPWRDLNFDHYELIKTYKSEE
jgi:hypothetical protein